MSKHESYLAGFISRAEGVLEAHKELTSRGLVRLPADPTQFDITNTYMDVTASMLDGLIERSRFFMLKPLFTQISRDYRTRNGYASVTDDRLIEFTGVSEGTLKRLRPLILSAGIWGKVSGDGHTATRYYPLLTERGYQTFVKLVEDAKKGIHPLYGPVTDAESVEDEKPQPKPASATAAAPEVVEAPSEDLPENPSQLEAVPSFVPAPVAVKPSAPKPAPEPEVAKVVEREVVTETLSAPTNRSTDINPITGRPYKIAKPRVGNPMTKRERAALEQAAIQKAKETAPDILTNGSGAIATSLPEGTRINRTYSETM